MITDDSMNSIIDKLSIKNEIKRRIVLIMAERSDAAVNDRF